MAKKLNSMPDYVNRAPKSVHDVSQSLTYTSAPGMILPVYWDMLHHGDKIHFSVSQFSRLNPIVKPALTKLDIHIDSFFVPLPVLYTLQPSMEYGTDDMISSLYDKSDLKTHYPILDFEATFDALQTGTPSWRNTIQGYNDYDVATHRGNAFECLGKSFYRLFNHLELNPHVIFRGSEQGIASLQNHPSDTPWSLCAYQAIYQLYEGFRNTDREAKDYSYNLDKYYNVDSFTLDTDSAASKLFRIRYANQYKDFFNSVKVSPLASSVNLLFSGAPSGTVQGDYLTKIDNWLGGTNAPQGAYPLNSGDRNNSSAPPLGADSTGVSANLNSTSNFLNTGIIRSMFAVEKLLRVVGRADKNYESQVLAHFGFKVPHDVLHNITHIGHDMVSLSPSPVISTADTFVGGSDAHGSALGEIGGQGSVTLTGRKRHFEAPCLGVFMVVAYCIPRFRYYGTFNPLNGMTERIKFYQPEFDRLGMQPLWQYYFNRSQLKNATRQGWQFRYEQFKRKYDRVTDCFAGPDIVSVNAYEPWVLSKQPYNGWSSSISSYEFLKVYPTDFNTIMEVPYDPRWSVDFFDNPHLIFQTDPFINDFTCRCKKVNIMSEYGEPEL